ncbi:hypothetical protein EI77_04317 [Prosthecobacter fusiformis]|uniref:Uncharacterized protein n=1 Tax=Prosthecobacter fusiformis TaxID=48464 RepID=A0A4R7RL22_9BACT|nr:hypothetical protein [Prosthecobacter fusiformis]TDU64133.1 hypothetical protein EI77_04317 [Prosthecobacter fusiformis]
MIAWARITLSVIIMTLLTQCVSPMKTKHTPDPDVFFHSAQPPPGGTQKWNPLWWVGNADDPVPPHWYRPGQKMRSTLWQLRNPMHNFTFYVIGIHDKEFVRLGKQPGAVFRKGGGWNWAVIHHGWLRLPFVSYEGENIRWYALWREKGNFGLKLHRHRRE